MQYNQKNMYEKLCYKSSTLKIEKLNNCNNISNVLHLPFDMLCYLLKSIMALWKMH